MPWFKVDDNLAFHAKTIAAGNAAMGMWVRAGSWSAATLTDGFVPNHMLTSFGSKSLAKKLVQAGFWVEAEGGYQFHEWTERQPTKDTVEKDRVAARERMRVAREAKRSGNVRANIDRTSGEVRSTRPDPTRPTTSNEVVEGETAPPKSTRGSRLPEGWKPTADVIAKLEAQYPHVDQRAEYAKFVDYWLAQPGQKGVKADWDATWRNWIRRAGDDNAGGSRVRGNSPRPSGQGGSRQAQRDAVDDIAARFEAQLAGHTHHADYGTDHIAPVYPHPALEGRTA